MKYEHVIGEIGEKNDISFVISAFDNCVVPLCAMFDTIHIFSDGGPKHFKLSSLIYYFFVSNKRPGKRLFTIILRPTMAIQAAMLLLQF